MINYSLFRYILILDIINFFHIDADTNNHYKKNKIFQESIIQEKQTGKKKTKFIAQRIEDAGKPMEKVR